MVWIESLQRREVRIQENQFILDGSNAFSPRLSDLCKYHTLKWLFCCQGFCHLHSLALIHEHAPPGGPKPSAHQSYLVFSNLQFQTCRSTEASLLSVHKNSGA